MDRRQFCAALSASALLNRSGWAGANLAARAPSLVIAIDHSSDSPCWVPEIMRSAARDCSAIIEKLPMASKVAILIAGDPVHDVPVVLTEEILARRTSRGGPPQQVAAKVVSYMTKEFPRRPKPDSKSGSSIIGMLSDANRLLNPEADAPNQVYIITNGVEISGLARCDQDCRLPKPHFRFPPRTRVQGLGFGLGLSDTRNLWLWRQWEPWFTAAGAGDLMLYRTR